MEQFMHADFWIAVGQIIMIDILLGGDNAVVIALACRKLPPAQRTQGILWGTVGAILLRVVLIFFALTLLSIPYLKLVGAILLVWIGVKLLAPGDEDGHGDVEGSDKLWAAVRTVIVADLVMSVDNVIAIAGAAESAGGDHKMPLVIFGLLVSIPIIVWGSQFVIKLMDRFPVVITIGGMLLAGSPARWLWATPRPPASFRRQDRAKPSPACAMGPGWRARCWCWPWGCGSNGGRHRQPPPDRPQTLACKPAGPGRHGAGRVIRSMRSLHRRAFKEAPCPGFRCGASRLIRRPHRANPC